MGLYRDLLLKAINTKFILKDEQMRSFLLN